MKSGEKDPIDRSESAPERVDTRDVSRDDVKVDASPTRCPYCHEHVATDAPGWVACGGCMARHHAACWDERGACASCGGVRRLVAEERRLATDPEVIELLRTGDRIRALAELRARGLDDRAARTALDLVFAALDAPRANDAGWLMSAVVYALQAVAMFVCAVITANTAEGGAVSGLVVMLAGTLGLGLAAGFGDKHGSRPWLAFLAVLNVLAIGLGPLLIVIFDIPASRGSLALFLLAVTLAAGSIAGAVGSVIARKTTR